MISLAMTIISTITVMSLSLKVLRFSERNITSQYPGLAPGSAVGGEEGGEGESGGEGDEEGGEEEQEAGGKGRT